MSELVAGRVSVITACFNDGQWLPETLASVSGQTHSDIEHIVVDDGSTDRATRTLLASLDEEGVRVLRVTHGGLPRARNAGVAASSGEFVLPLDSDDLIDPTYCAKGVAALRAHPAAALVVPNTREFGDRDLLVRPLQLPMGAALHDLTMYAAMLFRRRAFDEVGGYDESFGYAEDDELWVRMLDRHPERAFVDEALYFYRIRPGQMTSQRSERSLPARAEILRKNVEIYARHAEGFLGRIRAERRSRDHFVRRYARFNRLLDWSSNPAPGGRR